MQAIQTYYKGILFRSRLEARWAVFFDCMNIIWEYELEGFQDRRIKYLPDFWLPQVSMWAEIKYRELNEDEIKKAKKLVVFRQHPVLMLIGSPTYKNYYAIELDPWNDKPTDAMTGWDYSLVNDFLCEGRFPCANYISSSNNFDWPINYQCAVDASKSVRFESWDESPEKFVDKHKKAMHLLEKAIRMARQNA